MSLNVEFMNQSPRGSFSRSSPKSAEKQPEGGLFWWTVAIVVLLGLATFSWISSVYIFTHPEKPWTYRLLGRFHKLDEIKRFSEKNVPDGKTFDARNAYQQFYSWGDEQFATQNDLFRRGYLTNYKDEKPVYLKGVFKVLSARPLEKADVFGAGLVVRAVAMTEDKEFHNVMIEYILPTGADEKIPAVGGGDLIAVDVSPKGVVTRSRGRRSYASVMNINRVDEDTLLFSLVPLLYDTYEVAPQQAFKLAPPSRLNLEGRWPITDATAAPEASVAQVDG